MKMKVKIFQSDRGAPTKIRYQKMEEQLNDWLEKEKPVHVQLTSAINKQGEVVITALYHERSTQKRERGVEAPGNPPMCPACSRTMVKRIRRSDGEPFWGCPGFPACREVINFDELDKKAEAERSRRDDDEFMGGNGYEGGNGFGPDDDDIPF